MRPTANSPPKYSKEEKGKALPPRRSQLKSPEVYQPDRRLRQKKALRSPEAFVPEPKPAEVRTPVVVPIKRVPKPIVDPELLAAVIKTADEEAAARKARRTTKRTPKKSSSDEVYEPSVGESEVEVLEEEEPEVQVVEEEHKSSSEPSPDQKPVAHPMIRAHFGQKFQVIRFNVTNIVAKSV